MNSSFCIREDCSLRPQSFWFPFLCYQPSWFFCLLGVFSFFKTIRLYLEVEYNSKANLPLALSSTTRSLKYSLWITVNKIKRMICDKCSQGKSKNKDALWNPHRNIANCSLKFPQRYKKFIHCLGKLTRLFLPPSPRL